MTAHEYFGDWSKVLDVSEAERILHSLYSSKQPVCPLLKDVFKAFSLCSLHDLKVVILGQEPYSTLHNGVPIATGLAFANAKDTSEDCFSPSLDVLMESVINFSLPHEVITFDPTLERWSGQGVLMLNSALTCLAGQSGSHTLLWRPFIKSFFTRLSAYNTGIVYVLMGREAQSFEPYINRRFNHIFKTHHPSWYARSSTPMPNTLWLQVNAILKGLYGSGICWYEEQDIFSS